MRVWSFLRPTWVKLLVLAILISITLLVVIERQATSKVTWNESRGAPLPFLTLAGYQGPCPPLSFCTKVFFHALHPIEMLLDILVWYVVSCVFVWGYTRLLHRRSRGTVP